MGHSLLFSVGQVPQSVLLEIPYQIGIVVCMAKSGILAADWKFPVVNSQFSFTEGISNWFKIYFLGSSNDSAQALSFIVAELILIIRVFALCMHLVGCTLIIKLILAQQDDHHKVCSCLFIFSTLDNIHSLCYAFSPFYLLVSVESNVGCIFNWKDRFF